MAERRLNKLLAQSLTKSEWAFAKVSQQDEQLFKALARMAEQRLDKFTAQDFGMTTWAFAEVSQQDEQLLYL